MYRLVYGHRALWVGLTDVLTNLAANHSVDMVFVLAVCLTQEEKKSHCVASPLVQVRR
jgi:hypothetical protein